MTIPANSKQCSACGGVIPEESPLCPMCPDPRIANLESELAQARAEIERLKLQSEHADCWWNDDNRVGSPEEYADEEALKVGEEFELLAAAYWPTKYRVTAVRDHETDEGEYTCELLKGRREEFETYFQIKSERDSLRARLLQPTKVEERVTVEYVSASDEFGWKVFKDRTESGLFRDQENAEIYRLGLIAKLKGQNK